MQTLLPKTGKFTGNTSLDSEVARLSSAIAWGVTKVPHAWAANRNREKQGTLSEFPTRWHFPQTKFPKQLSFGLV